MKTKCPKRSTRMSLRSQTRRNPPQPSLLRLPNELLAMIAERVDKERDLSALARTCHLMYDLTIHRLYRINIEHRMASGLVWLATHGHDRALRFFFKVDATLPREIRVRWRKRWGFRSPFNDSMLECGSVTLAHFPTELPLTAAAKNGHLNALDILRAEKADPNIRYGEALAAAAKTGRLDVVRHLVNSGCSVRHAGKRAGGWEVPLIEAARHGHLDVVKYLVFMLKIHAEPDKDEEYVADKPPLVRAQCQAALPYAIKSGNVDVVRVLTRKLKTIDFRFPLNGRPKKDGPVELAVRLGKSEMVEVLLRKNPYLDRKPHDIRDTPLEIAVRDGRTDLVKMLLEYGAGPGKAGTREWNWLRRQAMKNGMEEIDALLEKAFFEYLEEDTGYRGK